MIYPLFPIIQAPNMNPFSQHAGFLNAASTIFYEKMIYCKVY